MSIFYNSQVLIYKNIDNEVINLFFSKRWTQKREKNEATRSLCFPTYVKYLINCISFNFQYFFPHRKSKQAKPDVCKIISIIRVIILLYRQFHWLCSIKNEAWGLSKWISELLRCSFKEQGEPSSTAILECLYSMLHRLWHEIWRV